MKHIFVIFSLSKYYLQVSIFDLCCCWLLISFLYLFCWFPKCFYNFFSV